MPVEEREWKASDGSMLQMKVWLPADGPKAWIVAMHGLNCCFDDWQPLAGAMLNSGVALAAWNLRGQGLDPNPSRRGAWLDVHGMIADLERFLDEIKPESRSLFLTGDSMGALLALRAATDPGVRERISGLMLFVPVVALAQRNPPWIKGVLRLVSRLWPSLRLNPSWLVHGRAHTPQLTRIAARQVAFESAPHRIHRQTPGFLADMGDLIESAGPAAEALTVPVAVFSAGRDVFVRTSDTEAFFRRLAAKDKTHFHYPEGYHQLLHDLDAGKVVADAVRWVHQRS